MPLPTTCRAACRHAYLVDRTGEQAAVKGESAALGVRKPRACRCTPWRKTSRLSTSSRRARCIATSPTRATCLSSTRWKVSLSTGISFGDLKGTLDYFCKQMFGPDRKTRFRAHYFPFTEPLPRPTSCGVRRFGSLAQRRECRMCKGTGWLEIGLRHGRPERSVWILTLKNTWLRVRHGRRAHRMPEVQRARLAYAA